MFRIGFLLMLATLADGGSLWAGSLPEKRVPQSLGFNIHVLGPERDLEMVAGAGVKFLRKDMFWNTVERSKGKYDFGGYDRFLKNLEGKGIRALFILCYGNGIYPSVETTGAGREAYARFAATAVSHFKGRNVLWELWNEPNVKHFWKGPGDHNSDEFAEQYIAMVKAAVPAMREADPDCYILGTATSCLWVNSFNWLDKCFELGLLQTGIDAISVHPYGFKRPEQCIDAGYGHLREMMSRYGAPPDFPVLNTEVGYGVVQDRDTVVDVGDEHQAWHFVRQHMVDFLCDIRLTIWYNWKDDPPHRVVEADLGERPVYTACKTMTSELAGYSFVRRLPTTSDLDYLFLFADQSGAQKLVAWTTPPGREEAPDKARVHPVTVPVNGKGSLAVCDIYGEKGSVAVDEGKITLALSGSPQYVELRSRSRPAKTEPIVLPDGTEVVIVGNVAVRRRPKRKKEAETSSGDEPTGGEGAKRKPRVRRPVPAAEPPAETEQPKEPPEAGRLLKEAETLFIEGDLSGAGVLFGQVVREYPNTPSAAKAREYVGLLD